MTKTQIGVLEAAQLWKRDGIPVSVAMIYIGIKDGTIPPECYEISLIGGRRKVYAINKAEFLDWLKKTKRI